MNGDMNPWVKRKWVKALRSGEYEKGNHRLGSGGLYCCLGVLVCEMVPEYAEGVDGRVVLDDDSYKLPDDLITLWGLDESAQRRLMKINDASSTHSFQPVIKYIEENL